MGAIKAIATELSLHWESHGEQASGQLYSRRLPDGTLAVATLGYFDQSWLSVDGEEVGEFDSVVGAIIRAGRIAREQLQAQMQDWTNVDAEVAA